MCIKINHPFWHNTKVGIIQTKMAKQNQEYQQKWSLLIAQFYLGKGKCKKFLLLGVLLRMGTPEALCPCACGSLFLSLYVTVWKKMEWHQGSQVVPTFFTPGRSDFEKLYFVKFIFLSFLKKCNFTQLYFLNFEHIKID